MSLCSAAHPGNILKLLLGKHTVQHVAKHLGVSAAMLRRVLNSREGISADLSLRLAEAFQIESGFWIELQRSYDFCEAHQSHRNAIEPLWEDSFLCYPLIWSKDGGHIVVTFPDLHGGVITRQRSLRKALAMAKYDLEFTIDYYFDKQYFVPFPSLPVSGQRVVKVSARTTTKVHLLNKMKDAGLITE